VWRKPVVVEIRQPWLPERIKLLVIQSHRLQVRVDCTARERRTLAPSRLQSWHAKVARG
jgi:hypothetical protein